MESTFVCAGLSELCLTASETLNAFLQKFHNQCAFMKQETFMKFLELILTVRNYLMTSKLQAAKDVFTSNI